MFRPNYAAERPETSGRRFLRQRFQIWKGIDEEKFCFLGHGIGLFPRMQLSRARETPGPQVKKDAFAPRPRYAMRAVGPLDEDGLSSLRTERNSTTLNAPFRNAGALAKTLMQTFLDAMPIARDKMTAACSSILDYNSP
jgi:hypothetical protein